MKCDRCGVDAIDVQSKMALRTLPAGKDWWEFHSLASVCPKCGKMEFQDVRTVNGWVDQLRFRLSGQE